MRWTRRTKWAAGLVSGMMVLGLFGYLFRVQIALAGFEWFFADRVKRQLEQSYQPIERTVQPEQTQLPQLKPQSEERQQTPQPFTILLLGTDSRGSERGRSDTMILTVVRPQDGALLLLSIPRDTRVIIPGRGEDGQGKVDKITHAYAYGGAALAVETVEQFFDLRIDHYASINFRGFRDVIDAIGGIKLPIEKDLVNDDPGHEHFVVKAGLPSYNGEDALNYVRYREDAGGDASRAKRQQIFLQAIIDKASGIGQWSKIPELIEIMGSNFATDIPPDELIDLAETMLTRKPRTICTHTLAGAGRMDGGAWYFIADERDVGQVRSWIQAWLDAGKKPADLPKPDSASAA